MKIGIFVLLIVLLFTSEQNENEAENAAKSEQRIAESSADIFEEDEFLKENGKTSKYVGVTFNRCHSNWRAIRWSKNDYTMAYSGPYKNEETAAHASDTLARKLMANGEHGHELNFPDDHTEVWPDEIKTSKYIGVNYDKRIKRWHAQRYSKYEKNTAYNGTYKDEETAAHASDNLARKLIANGEQNHKLNFPDDHSKMQKKEMKSSSKYIGVSYNKRVEKWHAQRHSKNENKVVPNGTYKDEENAAHASDTLARKLMKNGEQHHKLNFPNDHTELWPEKMKTSKYIGVSYNRNDERWQVQRHSKNEYKLVSNGRYKDEEIAAHASDTLARKLMANDEHGHKLNFPNDDTEVYPEHQRNKRKRYDREHLGYSQNK